MPQVMLKTLALFKLWLRVYLEVFGLNLPMFNPPLHGLHDNPKKVQVFAKMASNYSG